MHTIRCVRAKKTKMQFGPFCSLGVNNLSAELSQLSARYNAKKSRPLLLCATEQPAAISVWFVPSTSLGFS